MDKVLEPIQHAMDGTIKAIAPEFDWPDFEFKVGFLDLDAPPAWTDLIGTFEMPFLTDFGVEVCWVATNFWSLSLLLHGLELFPNMPVTH